MSVAAGMVDERVGAARQRRAVIGELGPTSLLTAGLCAEIFSTYWDDFGIPAAVDRLLVVAALVAFAAGFDGWEAIRRLRWKRVHTILLLASAYACLSALWAGTLFHYQAFSGLVDRFGLLPFVFFSLAPVAFRTRRQRTILLAALVATGAYLAFTTLAEGLGFHALVYPRYILDPELGSHAARARGPFAEAAADGVALIECAAVAGVAATCWNARRARMAASAVMVGCFGATFFTLTRSVWAAAVAVLVVSVATSPRLMRLLPVILTLIVIGVVAAFSLVPGLHRSATNRLDQEATVWDRRNQYSAAVRMLDERPLLGFGWQRGAEFAPQYIRQDRNFPATGGALNIHNVPLSNLVELGVLGTALWLLAVWEAIGRRVLSRRPRSLQSWRPALLAMAVAWLVVSCFAPLFQPFPNLVLWTWAGVVFAMDEDLGGRTDSRSPS